MTKGTVMSQTTTLMTGGTVTITLDVNLFDLSVEDEQFIMQIVAGVRRYHRRRAGLEVVAT